MTRRLAAAVIAESARKSSIARNAGGTSRFHGFSRAGSDGSALGSLIAATGGLLANQAPTKGQVVPELLRGLEADSFGPLRVDARTTRGRPAVRSIASASIERWRGRARRGVRAGNVVGAEQGAKRRGTIAQ